MGTKIIPSHQTCSCRVKNSLSRENWTLYMGDQSLGVRQCMRSVFRSSKNMPTVAAMALILDHACCREIMFVQYDEDASMRAKSST